MKVVNVHQRLLHATPAQVGALIDSLSSPHDVLAPPQWPRMKFDRPLGVGADGGHGPIRYFVESHVPGQMIRFRFRAPRGFDGWHGIEVLEATAAHCVLEHRVEMRTHGLGLLSWHLVFRFMHDAYMEDALSQAQAAVGNEPRQVRWSPYVRLLRWFAARLATHPQPRRGQAHAG